LNVVRKRSVTIGGHRTSYSIEDPFHEELVGIAAERRMPVAALIAEIDAARPPETNLSSAIRLHILEQLKAGRTG
jgi:predicted DNA-binding ribbon-helix-helix protein